MRRVSRGGVLALALLALACAGVAGAATTVYVNNGSASCSDAGPGTLASPFCTISAALAAHHAAGDSVVVLSGVYREQVTAPASGQSGKPITVAGRCVGGLPVVVDGADDYSSAALWLRFSGEVWLAPGVTWSPQQVFADGARLAASTLAPEELPPGSFRWQSGLGLFVNVGGDDPGGHHAQVGHRTYGFQIAGAQWWVIDGFAVTRQEWAGIYLTGSTSHVSVTRDSVTFAWKYGIQADGCTATLIGSNVTSDHLASGIALTSGATGCTVQDNRSYGNVTPGLSAGIYDYGAPGNVLQRNRVHDNAYSGIHVQSAAGVQSIQNRSWKNGADGYHDVAATGAEHVGDVAYGNNRDGFDVDAGSSGATLADCIAAVNGLVGLGYDLHVDTTATAGLASNDNLFWNPSGRAPVLCGSSTYATLAAWAAVSGHDTRSIQADPRFADPENGDLRLTWGSPAIDDANSGVAHWPATDATGATRRDDPATPNSGLGPVAFADRGALEFVPPGSPPPATVPHLDHVIVVVLENESFGEAMNADYIGGLADDYASFISCYAITHPSQPNYYALWAGTTEGLVNDDCPPPGSPYSGENLGHACETAGLTWRTYSEDLPVAGSSVCTASPTPNGSLYTRKHCPWTSFTNVNHANELPLTRLATDIASGSLPNLAFVIPNNCHNAHNADCPLDTADAWLAKEMPFLLSNVGPHGLVILTWDEDDDVSGNQILTVFAGPNLKQGYVSRRFVNLYTVLRTICAGLGIAPFGAAVAEMPITDVWVDPTAAVRPPAGTAGAGASVGAGRPNPFRAGTAVTLTLPAPATVSAEIYDLAGRRVRALAPATLAGMAEIRWDGRRDDGAPARPGVYLMRVRAGGREFTRRLVRLE